MRLRPPRPKNYSLDFCVIRASQQQQWWMRRNHRSLFGLTTETWAVRTAATLAFVRAPCRDLWPQPPGCHFGCAPVAFQAPYPSTGRFRRVWERGRLHVCRWGVRERARRRGPAEGSDEVEGDVSSRSPDAGRAATGGVVDANGRTCGLLVVNLGSR